MITASSEKKEQYSRYCNVYVIDVILHSQMHPTDGALYSELCIVIPMTRPLATLLPLQVVPCRFIPDPRLKRLHTPFPPIPLLAVTWLQIDEFDERHV